MELTLEQKRIIDLIDKLPDDLKKSTIEIISQMNNVIDETSNTVKKTIVRESLEKDENVLYFSIPHREGGGYFELLYSKDTFNPGSTYYKINIKTGQLNYVPSDFEKKAIENIENYLLPACDIENFSYRKNTSKVQVLEPGKVSKSGDRWIVEKKIKIKLI